MQRVLSVFAIAGSPTTTAALAPVHAVAGGIDPGTGAVIAAGITASILLVVTLVTQVLQFRRDEQMRRHQLKRDDEEYKRRQDRDEQEYRRQREREQAAHQQALKDARWDRLRAGYTSMLAAAKTYDEVAQGLTVLRPGQTIKERAARLEQQMEAAQQGLTRSLAALQLDGAPDDVTTRYDVVVGACVAYLEAYNRNLDPRATLPRTDLPPLAAQVADAVKQLIAVTRQHLVELDESEPSPAPKDNSIPSPGR